MSGPTPPSPPPDLLRPGPFDPATMLPLVADFEFGSEPFDVEIATWLREDSVQAVARGTQIWLYANSAGQIIGYGSLGTSNWRYPDPDSRRVTLAVGLRKEFQGCPPGVPREERYSSQIMLHLTAEAERFEPKVPAVGLYVHRDNLRAAKLYERYGFVLFHTSYTDPTTGTEYQGYIRKLPD